MKEVVRHLKGDIKMFKEEAAEDKALIKKVKGKDEAHKKVSKKSDTGSLRKKSAKKVKGAASKYENKKGKVHKVLTEFKEKKLHQGSKKGPLVKNKSQAIAIALNSARKAGAKIKPAKPNKKKK